MLSDKLRVLEEAGLIFREVDMGSKPPRIYYGLTEYGEEVALALVPALTIIKVRVKGFTKSSEDGPT